MKKTVLLLFLVVMDTGRSMNVGMYKHSDKKIHSVTMATKCFLPILNQTDFPLTDTTNSIYHQEASRIAIVKG